MRGDRPSRTAMLIARSLEDTSEDPCIGALVSPESVDLARGAAGRIAFRNSRRAIVDGWLRSGGEAFTWGLAADRVADFVASFGLDLVELAGADDLRARYLTGPRARLPLAAGEMICMVRKS